MLRKLLFLICVTGVFCLCTIPLAMAQSGGIQGTVTDSLSGNALTGTNVFVLGTSRGAVTDVDGNYKINNLEPGTYTVRATFIGYTTKTQSVTVGNGVTTVNFQLVSTSRALGQLVVTALGIKREARALGYSTVQVKSSALEDKGQADLVRTLKGKVPGVTITSTGGLAGTATSIHIRGVSTINGNTQPLFIVDGVKINTATNSQDDFDNGAALTTPSRFLDIDPNNIKSMQVLKGLAATAIYGSQGRNGVILITTKSGSFSQDEPGFNISLSQTVFASQIASMPDYQHVYGGGYQQNFGFFFGNYGPRFDSDMSNTSLFLKRENGINYVKSPYSQFSSADLRAAFPEYQEGGKYYAYPYKDYGSSVSDFFQTGLSNTTNINISGGVKGININLNLGQNNTTGFTPGNSVNKHNVGIGIKGNPVDKLTVAATANISFTKMKSPPLAPTFGSGGGGHGSVFGDVLNTPRSVDLSHLPAFNPVNNYSVYYRSGNDIQNPYWTVKNVKSLDNTNRVHGKLQANYELADGIGITYRLGLDTYDEAITFQANKGGPSLPLGSYNTSHLTNTWWDHNLFLQFDHSLSESLNLTGTIGGEYMLRKFNRTRTESDQQVIFGLFNHNNFLSTSASSRIQRIETAGAYIRASLGYKDYLYLNVSGRNDWFSTLEPANRSIFYPSGSISFIPTSAFQFGGDVLSYLKLRASVGTSASPPRAYKTRSVLSTDSRNFVTPQGDIITTNSVDNTLGNPNLKAQRLIGYEFGINSRWFNGRLQFNASLYRRYTSDLITDAQLDPSTGFTSTTINVGKLRNQGLEMQLTAIPVSNGSKFRWNTLFNFTTNETIVESLAPGVTQVAVHGYTNLGNFAIVGKPLNIMVGGKIKRDENGHRLVNSSGSYISGSDIGIIGNPNPKFRLSNINTFHYKGFSLTTQVDFRYGGDVYSMTIANMYARGVTTDTQFDRAVPLILPGYKQNGEPNDIQITASTAYFENIGFGPDELDVYDGTTLRLQEVSLGYTLPASLIAKTPFKRVSIKLSGYNLWFFTPYIPEGTNFDPNVSSTGANNGMGFDYMTGPSLRKFGGSVRINF